MPFPEIGLRLGILLGIIGIRKSGQVSTKNCSAVLFTFYCFCLHLWKQTSQGQYIHIEYHHPELPL